MIFLMDLPPPVHGMSNVNLAMLAHAKKKAINLRVINTVPSYAEKFYPSSIWKSVKIFHTTLCLFRLLILLLIFGERIIYRPINGGSGQIFDIAYLKIAQLFNCKIYIHHHSFNYLNSYSPDFNKLNNIAGKNAIHVVLGKRMADTLSALYGISKDNISPLSNLAFFDNSSLLSFSHSDNGILKIGHLANLCQEKGIGNFIKICLHLIDNNISFEASIAGPFADLESKKLVENAVNNHPNIKYLGPLYGTEKSDFYRSLDCFIFPSEYKNEAEPLVLYEAAMCGVYVMGSQRGCMQDSIAKLNGYSSPENDDLANNITHDILSQIKKGGFSLQSRNSRKLAFEKLQSDENMRLNDFFKEIADYDLSKTK
jgi:glycosyltransferase involved in cell wall biosynthesis